MKPKTLLKKFQTLYRRRPPNTDKLHELADFEDRQFKVKRMIVEIVQFWIKISLEELKDDQSFIDGLAYFVNSVISVQVQRIY